MSRYQYQTSYYHKRKKARRLHIFGILVVCVISLAIAYVVFDLVKEGASETSVTSESSASVQSAAINIFRTEYFQFQAPRSWREVASESKGTRFVYRSYRGPLVERDLIIEVNPQQKVPLSSVKTTRVWAVKINESGLLTPVGSVSKHCKEAVAEAANQAPQILTLDEVTFPCHPNGGLYEVVAGEMGGTEDLTISRPDGTTATYNIYYRDVTVKSDPEFFRGIIESFRTL
jgi:hypothetical protein